MHSHLLLGIAIYTLSIAGAVFCGWLFGNVPGMERRLATAVFSLGGLFFPVLLTLLGTDYSFSEWRFVMGFYLILGLTCDVSSRLRSHKATGKVVQTRDRFLRRR